MGFGTDSLVGNRVQPLTGRLSLVLSLNISVFFLGKVLAALQSPLILQYGRKSVCCGF